MEYLLDLNSDIKNGTASVIQLGSKGIITPTPDKGYEVDKIIVKDTTGNEIETTRLKDGTYSFELYDDVTIDVLFKEELVNPKTGPINIVAILFMGILISLSGLFILKNYNGKVEI